MVVADATCLSRNLNLVLQILEITPRAALCVNLLDEASRKAIHIDLDALSRQLGIPVIGITARERRDISRLKDFLVRLADTNPGPRQLLPPVIYPAPVEEAIARVSDAVSGLPFCYFSRRFTALKLLDNDAMAQKLLEHFDLTAAQRSRILAETEKAKQGLAKQGITPVDLRDQIVGSIVATSNRILSACSRQEPETRAAQPYFGASDGPYSDLTPLGHTHHALLFGSASLDHSVRRQLSVTGAHGVFRLAEALSQRLSAHPAHTGDTERPADRGRIQHRGLGHSSHASAHDHLFPALYPAGGFGLSPAAGL